MRYRELKARKIDTNINLRDQLKKFLPTLIFM